MLQVARLAPNLLQEAADPVADFLLSQLNPDGGARDKSGKSDLYYTVFALEGLIALRREPPVDRVRPFLESHGDGAKLDLVHLACLARCWAAMPKGTFAAAERVATRIEAYREDDRGFGSLYQTFLCVGALEDLGTAAPGDGVAASVAGYALPDGSYANHPDIPAGTTPTTAGALALLRHLQAAQPKAAVDWLLARASPAGGFLAVPLAPIPDLLSTATALHALTDHPEALAPVKEKCLDYVDSLWTGKAFCGHWDEETPDAEYTYYGLLALGHLSLA